MSFPLFAAAMAMRAIGQYSADQDQAGAMAMNAGYYREQSRRILQDMFRQKAIFERKAAAKQGEQLINVGSRGSFITANQMLKLAYEKTLMDGEAYAIQQEGEFKARLAEAKAIQADQASDQLRSPIRLLTSAISLGADFASRTDFEKEE